MQKENFHTHTWLCKHASGTIEDYCTAAKEAEFTALGFSDHMPIPDGRWATVRMDPCELSIYRDDIENAQKKFLPLQIFAGLECEYDPHLLSYYKEELLGKYRMDYLISGAHWYPKDGGWRGVYDYEMTPEDLKAYADYVISAIESGLFLFIAHPDLFGRAYHTWDQHAEHYSREILDAASSLNVPLEINGYGFRKPWIETEEGTRPAYPWKHFWELAAEYDVPVVLSSDAHRPSDIAAFEDCERWAEECGLAPISLQQKLQHYSSI